MRLALLDAIVDDYFPVTDQVAERVDDLEDQIFAAFDLLEVDGESLLEVPLLERRRHLEGVLAPSPNVRLTPYMTRGLRSWRDTLQAQGFRRVVLKNWNSTYTPGRTTDDWLVIEKLKAATP